MIDEKITISKSKLPKLINDCIQKLEYYNQINDEDMYYSTLELLETTAKSYVLEKKLSEKDINDLLDILKQI